MTDEQLALDEPVDFKAWAERWRDDGIALVEALKAEHKKLDEEWRLELKTIEENQLTLFPTIKGEPLDDQNFRP